MDFLLKIGRNVSDLVRRMSWPQRLSVVALVVVLIGAVSVLVSYSVGTEWVPLFDKAAMGPEDAKEAMRRIEESGVRYREVGGQISVPKESRYRRASTTFLFDKSFSTSPFRSRPNRKYTIGCSSPISAKRPKG
jgi:flagellar biosynthesis/type III secretory pathway M-ring protein FliF/YscJ